jgi:SagB-type dehydrogenase family enzyme
VGQTAAATALQVTVQDELSTDHILETDLVVDGRRQVSAAVAEFAEVPDNARPVLALGTRTYVDEAGAARICLPLGEPTFEARVHSVRVQRVRREVVITGDLRILWGVTRLMDGKHTVSEIVAATVDDTARQLIARLVATGAVDVSGRPIARSIHLATKKGVLPPGDLDSVGILRLVTDGDYRRYPRTARTSAAGEIPEVLRDLSLLTRRRRSCRLYTGRSISRLQLNALLETACGVTGRRRWAGRELLLRAYPSSGGLYAIEIYPVTLAVDGLPTAVYHYRAPAQEMELIRDASREDIVAAAMPSEHEMISGVAVMFCLTACFARHERKYGEGGYRMLVAEAGHISQNLILAATALGLKARPFGGVFDGLLNRALGLDGDDEQFLLSVIVGHARDAVGEGEGEA